MLAKAFLDFTNILGLFFLTCWGTDITHPPGNVSTPFYFALKTPDISPQGICRYPKIFLKKSEDLYEANDTLYGPLGQNLHILEPKQDKIQKSKIL
jgi:hypothetical protein